MMVSNLFIILATSSAILSVFAYMGDNKIALVWHLICLVMSILILLEIW